MSVQEDGPDDRLARLSSRVASLESLIALQDTRARQIVPATRFLSIFLVLVAAGLLIAKLTLPQVSSALAVLIDTSMYTSIMASTMFSLLTMVIRNQMVASSSETAIIAVKAAR